MVTLPARVPRLGSNPRNDTELFTRLGASGISRQLYGDFTGKSVVIVPDPEIINFTGGNRGGRWERKKNLMSPKKNGNLLGG